MIKHDFGNIYDHFAIVYEYANGARVTSMASQIPGSTARVGQNIVGSKGRADGERIEGENPWKYSGPAVNGQEQEHKDMIASIRGMGPYLNHGKRVADSTMTAILGRMAAYTGREIRYDWALNKSQLDISPARFAIGDNPIPARPHSGRRATGLTPSLRTSARAGVFSCRSGFTPRMLRSCFLKAPSWKWATLPEELLLVKLRPIFVVVEIDRVPG